MDELYSKYFKSVYKYLLYLSKNEDTAEELVQETFYSAIKNISKFKNECDISAWLCKIAKNKYLTKLKKENKIIFDSNTDLDELDSNTNFVDELLEKEEKLELYKKIHELDDIVREIFYLRLKGELTFKDISEIIGKSESWVKVTFFRTKIKLKEELKDEN